MALQAKYRGQRVSGFCLTCKATEANVLTDSVAVRARFTLQAHVCAVSHRTLVQCAAGCCTWMVQVRAHACVTGHQVWVLRMPAAFLCGLLLEWACVVAHLLALSGAMLHYWFPSLLVSFLPVGDIMRVICVFLLWWVACAVVHSCEGTNSCGRVGYACTDTWVCPGGAEAQHGEPAQCWQ